MRFLLAVLFLCLPNLLVACPSAEDLEIGGDEPGVLLERCRELGRFEIPTGRGNVEVVMYGTRDADEDKILPILESLTFAGDALANLGPLTTHPIDVFISPTEYVPLDPSDNAEATARLSIDDTRCVISMFPNVVDIEFSFVLAHEFFHCVQFREFPSRQAADRADWWYEATSEWFANYTYQGQSYTDRFVQNFDYESIDIPITKMEYTNVVFFFWYSYTRGDSAIIDLMRAMPEDDAAQEDALAAIVDDDAFLEFAKAYFSRDIHQPGGRLVPVVPQNLNYFEWTESDTHEIRGERFQLYRAHLTFACGEWHTEQVDLNGKTLAKRQPDGEWEELPEDIYPDGEEEITYRFIGVSTSPDGFSVDIKAEKEPCTICPVYFADDSPEGCLVGEWTLVSGGLGEKIGEMLERTQLENVDYPDLDNVLVFFDDGTFEVRTEDSGHLESPKPSGDRVIGDVDFNFSSTGTWSLDGNKLKQCERRPDININLEMLDTSNDITENIRSDRFLGPGGEIHRSRTFECSGGTLTIREGGFFAPKVEWVYSK